jgi:hypothetical protein
VKLLPRNWRLLDSIEHIYWWNMNINAIIGAMRMSSMHKSHKTSCKFNLNWETPLKLEKKVISHLNSIEMRGMWWEFKWQQLELNNVSRNEINMMWNGSCSHKIIIDILTMPPSMLWQINWKCVIHINRLIVIYFPCSVYVRSLTRYSGTQKIAVITR